MLYTIIGGVTGLALSIAATQIFKIPNNSNGFFPSESGILIFLSMIVGASIGFGYGTSKIIAGNYP
jgi:hypothetical protein